MLLAHTARTAAWRAARRPPWRTAAWRSCTRQYAVLSPLSLLPADPAAGAIVSARAHGDVFAEAYLEALDAVVGLPGFGGLVVDDDAVAPAGGEEPSPSQQQPRPLPDDVLLVCLAHGYSNLEGVVTADDTARRGSAVESDDAAAHGARAAARTRAPLIGATVGSYRYGPFRVRPYVSLTAVRLPCGGPRVEPWVATGGALPRLSAYADIVTADASHFLALASPEAGLKERSGLLARLAHAFPSGRVACGTAMAAPLRSSDGALPAVLFCNFAPVGEDTTAVGFALHWGRGHNASGAHAFVDRAIAAAYADAEFDGLAGFAANAALEQRYFLSRNAAVGATRPMLPAASAAATASSSLTAAASVTPSAAAAPAAAPPAAPALPTPQPLPLLPGSSFIKALPADAPLPALPLFLVDTVVVPGQRVDFRVFEPRYRLMLKQYYESGILFAVTLPPARVGDYYELKADAAAAAEEAEAGGEGDAAALAGGVMPPTPTVLGAPAALSPTVATATSASASPAPAGGADRRVGTVVCVRHVHSVDSGSGRLALQLEGVRRVALDRAWVAPGCFGLVHGSGRWVDDADEGSTLSGATDASASSTAAAAAVAAQILTLLRGESPAHTRLRRLLASWGASGKQGVVLAPPGGGGGGVGGSAVAGAPSSGGAGGTGGSGGTSWDPDPLASLGRLTPEGLSWWLAEVLPVPQSVRQLYLDAPTTRERLSRQHAFLASKLGDLAVGALKSAYEPAGASAVKPTPPPGDGGAAAVPTGARDDPSPSAATSAAAAHDSHDDGASAAAAQDAAGAAAAAAASAAKGN